MMAFLFLGHPSVPQIVKHTVAEVFGFTEKDVSEKMAFERFGGEDMLNLSEIICELEQRFGVQVDDLAEMRIHTVRDLIEEVQAAVAGNGVSKP